jgi:hypothetical protein
MTQYRAAIPAIVGILLLACAGTSTAQSKIPVLGTPSAPAGFLPPVFRVTGVRSSAQLATEIHCSNADAVAVSIYVSYFDYDNSYKCGVSMLDMPVGTTRTFTTADASAYLEDAFCAPQPGIAQGRVEIATFPENSKIVCSAQIISVTGNPPTTLSSLDVYRTH